jgi:hypothetical protein
MRPCVTTFARSRDGRALSRSRYSNAESFFAALGDATVRRDRDAYYRTGIVAQLALSAHLLDVGFDDGWCASNIGLDVARALQFANATGLDHTSPNFERLAIFLSPYGRWRNPDLSDAAPPECPFTIEHIVGLMRELLDHVRDVTGHSRPRGNRRDG